MDEVKEGAMEAPVKRTVGRPKGSRSFREGSPLPSKRMRDLMGNCYTDEEWTRRFKKLPASEQFRLRGMQEPKVREDTPQGNFILKVIGLGDGNTCPSCGWTQDPETYRKILAEKHRGAGSNSARLEGGRGQNWREAARAEGISVPAEGPKSERISGSEDDALAAPPEPLRDPDGNLINLSVPSRPAFPWGNGGIP